MTQAPRPSANSRPPEVVADDLHWTYRGAAMPALDGLSFRLPPGHTLLVLGPSGCGKSTLARALAGIVPHALAGSWSGHLWVDGSDVSATAPSLLGERVGLVFQDPESQLVMPRVEDEVAFGLENRGWPLAAMRERIPEALAEAGLAGFEPRASRSLSGGEQQRLALADVLAPLPGLLVFDEPTANLYPQGMVGFFERLGALTAGRAHTVVIIEHRLDAALSMADAVLLLDGSGRQLAYGAPDVVGAANAPTLEWLGGWIPTAWRGDRSATEATASDQAPTPARSLGPAVVRARGLTVRFREPGLDRIALADVDVEVRAGERVAVVGPNGCGKTTLLHVLAGVHATERGEVRLAAADGAWLDPRHTASSLLPDLVGLVFQDPEVGFVARSVRDEVAPPGGRGPDGGPDAQAVSAILERFGLSGLERRDPFRLSRGQQRRVSLAALAMRRPRVVLLDEPTYGLDRRATEQVLVLLDEGRDDGRDDGRGDGRDHGHDDGQAQVLATHDPRLLPRCDRVVALDRGRVVFDGSSAAFLADPPYRPSAPWRLRS